MDNPLVVGIDLGTTNSLAAVVRDGRPEVFRDASGVALVPSALCLAADGSVLVGSAAKAQALLDPEHTVLSVKRLMGRTLADLTAELPLIPQQLVERNAGGGRKVLRVVVGDRELTPEELSALILKEVRTRAGNPTKAVVTVPAYFDDAQRQATRDAGRIAGLDVLRIVNEPTAAALAYGLDKRDAGVVAVYDLGGGTFDCSVLKLSGGVFRVLSTNGDTRLGGDDFDRALYAHAAAGWGLDLTVRDPELIQHLRDAAERCKFALSESDSAAMRLTLPARGLDLTRTVTRAEFESLIAPSVDRSLARCRAALRDAELTPEDVNEVVLVGGSTRVPLVRRRVEEFFGRAPHADLNPDEVVALGAAIQADILAGGSQNTLLLDVVPLSLGIETLGGVVDKLIHRNQAVPCSATSRYTTFKDGQTAIKLTIYQGERELTQDCRRLGEFTLAGVPPMAAQLAQVDVTFLVDANGQLSVTAVEQRSGVRAEVRVQAASGLSPDEVEKLVLESVEHAHADFTTRQLIELRNKADGDLRAARKVLAEQRERLAPEQRAAVDAAVAELEAAAAAADLRALQRALPRFNDDPAVQALAELNMSAVTRRALGGQRPDEMGL